MFFLIGSGEERPSILDRNKDEDYHRKWGRYSVGNSNNQLHQSYLDKIALNKRFYKGDQWFMDEDVQAFLKDDTNQDRGRIKAIDNVIRPMVEQYRGNAIRMNINYRAKSISPQAINRREQALAEQQFYSKVANQPGNPYKESMKKNFAIGNNPAETASIVDNLYVDKYVTKINCLLKYVSERNHFVQKQVRLAESMALAGIGIKKYLEYGGHQEFENVQPENFFWDRSAREYDLSDSEYMGEVTFMTTSQVFEMYPDINNETRKNIEAWSRQFRNMSNNLMSQNGNNSFFLSGKVPVFTTYWRDGEKDEYGYVKDQYGYDYLTKINFTPEGAEKPTYTDADLIKSDSERAKRILKGKLKKTLHTDVLRTCTFIPAEIMASNNQNEKFPDIMLDWGIAPYQETENLDFASVAFPYKCYCWGYIDGEVMSPIDDAINPQRMINRLKSVAENQINNSRGSGIAYDGSAMDPQTGEAGMLKAMNQSKPVKFNAKGRGIQNIVTTYDTTVKQGTMVLYNLSDIMKKDIQQTTGVNDALKGESTGSDQLVGVTQLLIQKGSLMQEPFYNALTMIEWQCYQSIATVGKRIYADNERNLAMAVGDEGMEMIRITKDMKLEDFRCFIKKENPDEILIDAGNQVLMQLLELQVIDKERFSMLWGRSTPDEVGMAMRASVKEAKELQRMQQEKQGEEMQKMEAQAQQDQVQQQNMMNEQTARTDVMDLQNKQFDMKKTAMQGLGKIAPVNPKAADELLKAVKQPVTL